jgi:chemotaxis protein histidine kinase CheA
LLLRNGQSLAVDRMVGTVEALVSLPPFPINLLPVVTGTTIAPDGSVLFVLDPAGLNPTGNAQGV